MISIRLSTLFLLVAVCIPTFADLGRSEYASDRGRQHTHQLEWETADLPRLGRYECPAAEQHQVRQQRGGHDGRGSRIFKRRDFDSSRLFMEPGMGRCGGEGPNVFDKVGTLDQGVEQNKAPEKIVALHSTNGQVDRTRPLCPYPQGRNGRARAASTMPRISPAGCRRRFSHRIVQKGNPLPRPEGAGESRP